MGSMGGVIVLANGGVLIRGKWAMDFLKPSTRDC